MLKILILILKPMYNLIEYIDVYLKTSGVLWQYYTDEPTLDNNDNIIDFPANNNNSILLKFKQQITRQTGNGDTKNVEIMDAVNYLSNFWRTVELKLTNCKINLQLKWSEKCILVAGTAGFQDLK